LETLKLATLIRFVDPDLTSILTNYELEMPVVIRDGINSVTNQDILEIIEASIIRKGAFYH